MKKRLSLLMVLMMVVSLLPMSAFAASTAYPGSVPNVDVDDPYQMSVTFELNNYTDLATNKLVRFELVNAEFTAAPQVNGASTGVQYDSNVNDLFYWNTGAGATFTPPNNKVTVAVAGNVKVTDTGDVQLVVVDDNSGIGSQTVTIAKGVESSKADLAVTVKDAEKVVSFDGGSISQFEVKNFDNIIASDRVEIELDDEDLSFTAGTVVLVDGIAQPTSVIQGGKIVLTGLTSATKSVVVTPQISVGRKAAEGNISVTVAAFHSGENRSFASERATVGKITDYSVTITAVEKGKKEIPSVWGGEEATVTVTLKGPKGSLLNRPVDFTVDGADVIQPGSNSTISVKPSTATGGTFSGTTDGDVYKDGEFTIGTLNGDATELKFDIKIKTDADKDGVATITAAQRGWEVTADLAKVTPKFKAVADVTPVKKGEARDTANVVITEAKAGLLGKNDTLTLKFDTRRDYTQFATKSVKVEATNGMKFGEAKWGTTTGTLTAGADRSRYITLELPIERVSSGEPAVITVSGLKVLVDGSATDDVVKLEAGILGDVVSKVDYVKVVKEYDLESILSVFTIGQTTYTVNGIEKSAASAPYIKEGRTMLPIRAVAESLGLTVQWNSATKTASFTDASKVAAVTIGAKVMYVNGTPMPLSAAAELVNDTTFVELRSLATAFGVQIDWDAAAKTATVSK